MRNVHTARYGYTAAARQGMSPSKPSGMSSIQALAHRKLQGGYESASWRRIHTRSKGEGGKIGFRDLATDVFF